MIAQAKAEGCSWNFFLYVYPKLQGLCKFSSFARGLMHLDSEDVFPYVAWGCNYQVKRVSSVPAIDSFPHPPAFSNT